ncbi:Protein of unknown function, partial [Gryllus bimaculatus]
MHDNFPRGESQHSGTVDDEREPEDDDLAARCPECSKELPDFD